MILVSSVITAVPERRETAERLHRELDHAPIFWDHDHVGAVYGIVGALWTALTVEPDATHILVVEDDAVLCRNFMEIVKQRIEERPQAAISYCWLGKYEPMPAERWVERKVWWGTQAYSLPVDLAVNVLDWLTEPDRREWVISRAHAHPGQEDQWARAGDAWLRFCLEEMGCPMSHTVPSYVQHGAPDTTTVGSRINDQTIAIRRSPWYVDE